MPKISIIVPLYNKAPYVEKALESILAQSFGDWECIIVDDGSTDNSAQVVREWIGRIEEKETRNEKRETRFHVIHQENSGVSAARNRGIAESKGEYIAFLDADDWWAPTFLEEMMQLAADYPEAGIYASNYIYYKPGKTRVGVKDIYDAQDKAHYDSDWRGYINYPRSYYTNGGQVVWTGATMMDRARIEDCRLERGDYFQRGVKLGEDFLLWSRMAMRYPVAFTSHPLAYYNNDVPATLRLTCNVHRPEAHMLWHLEELEEVRSQKSEVRSQMSEDWEKLFSKLRAMGLVEYWLQDEYHAVAKEELKKVAWDKLDDWKDKTKYQRLYTLPRWMVRAKQRAMRLGSVVKQKIMHR